MSYRNKHAYNGFSHINGLQRLEAQRYNVGSQDARRNEGTAKRHKTSAQARRQAFKLQRNWQGGQWFPTNERRAI